MTEKQNAGGGKGLMCHVSGRGKGGAGGAPPTSLWGARLVGEAGLRAPIAGLHAGAA
jgi:hypothetical protein